MAYHYMTQEEMETRMPGIRKETVDWKPLFTKEVLEKAKSPEVQRQLVSFNNWGSRCFSRYLEKRTYYQIDCQKIPSQLGDTWEETVMACSCRDGGPAKARCVHVAAMLLRLEKEHGPWILYENQWQYQKRVQEQARKEEMERREALREKLGDEPVPALTFFAGRSKLEGLVFFDLSAALKGLVTTPYYMARAKEVLKEHRLQPHHIQIAAVRDGERWLEFSQNFDNDARLLNGELYTFRRECVQGSLQGKTLEYLDSSAQNDWQEEAYEEPDGEDSAYDEVYEDEDDYGVNPRIPLDEYQLAMLSLVWDYIEDIQKQEQDQTDDAAKTFFRALEDAARKEQETQQKAGSQQMEVREKNLALAPRIVIENGNAMLSFKLGYRGGRLFVLKNLAGLANAYLQKGEYQLTKKVTVDFASLDFTDESMPLAEFIVRRVGEIGALNEKLMYKGIWGRGTSLTVGSGVELKGAVLDNFYDIAKGNECEYQDKTNLIQEALIPVGHRPMQFALRTERLSDAHGTFAGVAVSGLIPVMLKGSSGNYILNRDGLSRITASEMDLLRPFRKVADKSGYFRFCVGVDNLQEFYYRVLPQLMENPCVQLEDSCAQEAEQYLPPEPAFTFWLDLVDGEIRCRCDVSYTDAGADKARTYRIEEKVSRKSIWKESGEEPAGTAGTAGKKQEDAAAGGYRDTAQEKRVQKVLKALFQSYDQKEECYCLQPDDDDLFEFLNTALPQLERLGQLRGTDVFRRQTEIRPLPQVQMGVSVESGLMDLSVTSKELNREELLEVFESYRRRKRYYRLKSGAFIDFSDAQVLGEMDVMLREMDLSPDMVIGKKAQMPLYRALYLDRMLEEHDAVATTRDRTYRALIRNFRTIRDAEYELPALLEHTIRPYQNEGFKWLKTLEGAGFGGILADEMGLGKTLQMISVFLSDKESGITKPSLVVCPASLIFNWQEEMTRFAPQLRTAVMSGTLSVRKKTLQAVKEGNVDVLVSSYDTLKRDIALYEGIFFHICVLDEAQFIKNAKAAVAKTVKVVHADHRFALTGTPIENRLSELWSIFDFLMPGFLYTGADFTRRFETPIVKGKDEEATQKLKKMTAPFVLRRCKGDVLKDLPAKLEEVRYARISGEQQKVYDAQVLHMKGMLRDGGNAGEDKIRIFAELTRIRQICCDPSLLLEDYRGESAKRDACLELIRSAMDGGHRMLVFSQFTSMLALLEQDLKEAGIPYYVITGATPKEKRLSLVHAFNEGDIPVFLISLKAGGTGLNLTGADVVIHYDPWWNLAAQNQATDRAHRIGQTRQVTVYRLILKDTIEEKILQLQEAKKDLADAILEGSQESIMSLSNEELLALLG